MTINGCTLHAAGTFKSRYALANGLIPVPVATTLLLFGLLFSTLFVEFGLFFFAISFFFAALLVCWWLDCLNRRTARFPYGVPSHRRRCRHKTEYEKGQTPDSRPNVNVQRLYPSCCLAQHIIMKKKKQKTVPSRTIRDIWSMGVLSFYEVTEHEKASI